MYKIDVTIEGVAPIRFSRVITLKGGTGKPTEEQEYEMAKLRIYRKNGLYSLPSKNLLETLLPNDIMKSLVSEEGKGTLILPAQNLKRSLRLGSSMAGLKIGRRGFEPYINAAVFIEPSELEFGKDEPDFMYSAYVRIPPGKRGALIFKVRPCLNLGWQLNLLLHVLDDHIEANKLRIAADTAGLYIGLCDGRPEYGRFIVKKWEVKK